MHGTEELYINIIRSRKETLRPYRTKNWDWRYASMLWYENNVSYTW